MGIRKVYGVVLPTGAAVQAPPNSTNFDIKLGDAAGARYFRIVDSSTVEQFKVDSDGGVTIQGTLASSGTYTVGGTFTASSSGLVSGGLTVSKTLTGSSNMDITGTGTVGGTFTASSSGLVSGGLTVSGTITGSSALSVTAASTFAGNLTVGGALTVSSGVAVTAASTFSAGVTIGGTITGSSALSVTAASTFAGALTVGGTLTASSGITASQGVTHPRAVASTAANLVSYGILDITSTAAAAFTIDAPVAGRSVLIWKTGNSTAIASVTVSSTVTDTWDGTNTALTFDGVNQFAEAVGNSSTRWLLKTSTVAGGYSKS